MQEKKVVHVDVVRAALYPRVSTEEQAKFGLSIHDQQNDLEKYAKDHGMKIVGVFADAGFSARKKIEKRPAMMDLLRAVEEDKIDIILVTKLDRWFRNIGEYYKVQEILEAHNVNWKTIYEDYDTSTASGRLKINIMLAVAQDEADRTSERIKNVFDSKRARCEPLTGNKPLGYIIEGKKFVKDPKTEDAVNAFFKKYMACGSVSATQDYIREEYGLVIPYQGANKMLRSPAYYGTYYGMDGMCPPYITKEQYDKIQSLRHKIVKKTEENRVYLFSGLIICGDCGGRIGGKPNQDQKTLHYNCSNHFCRRKPCGNNRSISERKLERYLLDTVEAKMEDYKTEIESIEKCTDCKDYRAEISSLRGKLSRLKDLYINEMLTLEEYKKDYVFITEKIKELEMKQQPHRHSNLPKIEKLLSGNWRDVYKSLSQNQRREFWRIIIKEIRWYPDRHIEFDINF